MNLSSLIFNVLSVSSDFHKRFARTVLNGHPSYYDKSVGQYYIISSGVTLNQVFMSSFCKSYRQFRAQLITPQTLISQSMVVKGCKVTVNHIFVSEVKVKAYFIKNSQSKAFFSFPIFLIASISTNRVFVKNE